MFNINQISITKKHQACTLETKPNLDGGGYKSIMKYQITWEAFIVISVSSAKRRTIRQNEGLKCTMNLQIMDSHTPGMIVCDSGEQPLHMSSASILHCEEQGKSKAVRVLKVNGSCFYTTIFIPVPLKWKLCSTEVSLFQWNSFHCLAHVPFASLCNESSAFSGR